MTKPDKPPGKPDKPPGKPPHPHDPPPPEPSTYWMNWLWFIWTGPA